MFDHIQSSCIYRSFAFWQSSPVEWILNCKWLFDMQSEFWLSISALEHASLAPLASMGGPLTPNLWKGTKTQSGRCVWHNHGKFRKHDCMCMCNASSAWLTTICTLVGWWWSPPIRATMQRNGTEYGKTKAYYRRQFHHEQAAGTPGSMCIRCLRKSCRMTCRGQSVSQDFEEIYSICFLRSKKHQEASRSIEKCIEAPKEPRHSHVTMVTWCQVSDIFIRPQYFVSGITLVEQSSDELCFRILSEWCYIVSQMHLKSSKGMNPMTPMTLIMTVAMRSRHLWGNNHEYLEALLARRCHSIAESWSIISRPAFFAGSLRFVMLCSRKHTMTVQLSSWPRNCVQTPDPSALSSRDLNGMQMVCSQNYIKLQRISKATGRHTCVPRVGERKLNRGQMEWERWSQMFLLSRSDLVNKLGWWRALGGLGSVGSGLEVGGLSPCSSASKM